MMYTAAPPPTVEYSAGPITVLLCDTNYTDTITDSTVQYQHSRAEKRLRSKDAGQSQYKGMQCLARLPEKTSRLLSLIVQTFCSHVAQRMRVMEAFDA